MSIETKERLKVLANHVCLKFDCGCALDWDSQDEWQQNANGYRCTLHYKRRQYTFDFWQGVGHSEDPTAEGCLECLLSDAFSGADDFEEFCANMGYDSDSRRAERIWRQCHKVAENLKRLLGDDYERFLYAERD